MRKKKMLRYRSIKIPSSGTNTSNPPTLPASPSYKLYRHISTLPLDRFIECFCEGSLHLLIIEGEVEKDELARVWEEIYSDFIDKMQDEDGQAMRSQIREMNLLKTKINTVATIVDYIRWLLGARFEVELDEILAELNTWTGLSIRLDQKDKSGCFRTLDMVMAHVMTWKVEGEQMRQEVERGTAGEEGFSKMDREYFDSVCVAISIANKFQVNRKETMTGEFVILVQTLRRQIAEAKKFSEN